MLSTATEYWRTHRWLRIAFWIVWPAVVIYFTFVQNII